LFYRGTATPNKVPAGLTPTAGDISPRWPRPSSVLSATATAARDKRGTSLDGHCVMINSHSSRRLANGDLYSNADDSDGIRQRRLQRRIINGIIVIAPALSRFYVVQRTGFSRNYARILPETPDKLWPKTRLIAKIR